MGYFFHFISCWGTPVEKIIRLPFGALIKKLFTLTFSLSVVNIDKSL